MLIDNSNEYGGHSLEFALVLVWIHEMKKKKKIEMDAGGSLAEIAPQQLSNVDL